MKKHLLILFAAFATLAASAHDFEVNGIYYNITSSTTAEVTYRGSSYYEYSNEYSGSITLPATVTHNDVAYSVTSIGGSAFDGCTRLTSITIPKGVTSIGSFAFQGCSSLTAITIPEGVTSIGYQAFYECSSLTAITIPEGVTSIGSNTFNGCSSLTAITIPEGVTSIGNWAFSGCSSLTDITCNAITPPTIGDSGTFNGVDKSIPLYVPASAVEAYQAAEGWMNFTNIQAMPVVTVTGITLDQTTATLTEGKSITLTATVTPEDADDTSVTWSSSDEDVAFVNSKGKVVAIGLGTATITVTANDGSGVSASCEIRVVADKCATPTISYDNGEIILTCDTKGAEIRTTATTGNDNEYVDTRFEFTPTYTFTAFATKDLYEDSDVVTLTICWIPCDEEHNGTPTNILSIPSHPVLISTQGGTITLSGLAEGTEVTLYTTDGTMVAHQQSSAGEAKFTVDTNQVYLVHIGDKVVKIGM